MMLSSGLSDRPVRTALQRQNARDIFVRRAIFRRIFVALHLQTP
jgi:hypothetical protein